MYGNELIVSALKGNCHNELTSSVTKKKCLGVNR